MKLLQNSIAHLILPATYLITVCVIALNLQRLPSLPEEVWLLGPGLCAVITATLALAYARLRILLVCLVIGFCLWLTEQAIEAHLLELIVTGLIPANVLLIAIYRERGSLIGLVRLALIAAQIGLLYYLMVEQTPIPANLYNPFGPPLELILQYFPFNQTAALVLMLVVLGSLVTLGLDDTPITQAVITTIPALLLAFHLDTGQGFELFLMAAALFLAASVVIDSRNLAYRDELTGLPHRRAQNEQFLSLSGRYSIAMLDVDHFKKFNDTHGHDVGDQVLQMVASRIRQVGGRGKPYRYGGEEFSIIFPRTAKHDAFYHLDELRRAVEQYEMVIRQTKREDAEDNTKKKDRQRGSFRTADKKVSVTISIGVAERGADGNDPEEVLKSADKALYEAKKAGRNQVAIAK